LKNLRYLLPGKGNSNSHGSRPVHLIITMIKWIRTSRLSIKNSLSETPLQRSGLYRYNSPLVVAGGNNYFTEMCSGSEAGSYFRLIDFLYHSILGLRVIKKKKEGGWWSHQQGREKAHRALPAHLLAPAVLQDVLTSLRLSYRTC